jgi:tRNA(Ile)-lysidine synthetase-like protein
MVRGWLESGGRDWSVSFRLIEEVLDLARGPAGRRLDLPGGSAVRRTQRELCLEPPSAELEAAEYEYRLPVPGQIEVPGLGLRIEAALADPKSVPPSERNRLLDPARLPRELTVRNWRAGDRFWPAHTKAAKKVKELLSDRHIGGPEKRLWPVAVAEGIGLVWMRGFVVPADLQPAPGASRVLWIQEAKTK